MEWTPIVNQIKDGNTVSAAVLNDPIVALTNRTQYLYDNFVVQADRTQLIARGQPIAAGSGVGDYSVVYFDGNPASMGLRLASPKMASLASHPFFRGADSAHVFGVVPTVGSSSSVDVVLQGLVASPDLLSNMLDGNTEANAGFVCGPLYLSSLAAGKLTPVPNGLAIFVAFAKSKDEIYFNPSQSDLAELFWTFSYDILDRPAGPVTRDATAWTITSVDPQKVGWIPATSKLDSPSLAVRFPDAQPKYFYQLPEDTTISTKNSELSHSEMLAAKNLRLALPARPGCFSFLTINGVVQTRKLEGADFGGYLLDELGLWWFSEPTDPAFDVGEVDQPWSSDLATSLPILTDAGGGNPERIKILDVAGAVISGLTLIQVNNNNNMVVGLSVKFTGTLPAPLASDKTYEVKEVGDDYFVVRDPSNVGHENDSVIITGNQDANNPSYLAWQPALWALGKGTLSTRPLMNLQFTKLNPDIRQNVVTSLSNAASVTEPAIKIQNAQTGENASTGDLQLLLNIPVESTQENAAASTAGTAIKTVSFNSSKEQLEVTVGQVVSSLQNGGGLRIDANPTTGVYTLAVADAYTNTVSDIEPEQARMEFYGLNSFLAMDYSTTPTGFVGKFVLPAQLVSASGKYLSIVLTMFGKSAPSSVGKKIVRFKFEYSIAKLGERMSSSVTTVASKEIELPIVTGSNYPAYHVFDCPLDKFQIPLTELSGKAIVNFRLLRLRTDPTNSLYDGVVGLSNVYWTLS